MLVDFRVRGGRLKLNYDNLSKGLVIIYDLKKFLFLKEIFNSQNGIIKINIIEIESLRKKLVKVLVCLNNGNEKFFVKFEYQYLLLFEKMVKSKVLMVYFL